MDDACVSLTITSASPEIESDDDSISCSGVILNAKCGIVLTHVCVLSTLLNAKLKDNESSFRFKPLEDKRQFIFEVCRSYVNAKVVVTVLNHGKPQQFPGRVLLIFRNEEFSADIQSLFPTTDLENMHLDSSLQDIFVVIKTEQKLCRQVDVLGSNSVWQRGDQLYTVSSPFGPTHLDLFLNTLSKGIVSGLPKEKPTVLLTDARCLPGSQGGGIFNEYGELGAMIVCPLGSEKDEWIGLTICCDIRSILRAMPHFQSDISKGTQGGKHQLDISKGIQGGKHQLDTAKELSGGNNKKHRTSFRKLFSMTSPMDAFDHVVPLSYGSVQASGIVLDAANGVIMTCGHAVTGCKSVYVPLPIGKRLEAAVIFVAPKDLGLDLAILRTSEPLVGFRSCYVNCDPLVSGAPIRALGYPRFNNVNPGPIMTSGVVSKGTKAQQYTLLSTCAVFPGMSGGAVVDDKNHVIAMIVCNAKDEISGQMLPQVNMSLPLACVWEPCKKYLNSLNVQDLQVLLNANELAKLSWSVHGLLEPSKL